MLTMTHEGYRGVVVEGGRGEGELCHVCRLDAARGRAVRHIATLTYRHSTLAGPSHLANSGSPDLSTTPYVISRPT